MKFEWDQQKNKANVAKHNLDFADAPKLFRLPRYKWRVVVVVFTEPSVQTIRIISLRKALPYERKRYEQYLRDELGES